MKGAEVLGLMIGLLSEGVIEVGKRIDRRDGALVSSLLGIIDGKGAPVYNGADLREPLEV
jgi:hypothetical protein